MSDSTKPRNRLVHDHTVLLARRLERLEEKIDEINHRTALLAEGLQLLLARQGQ